MSSLELDNKNSQKTFHLFISFLCLCLFSIVFKEWIYERDLTIKNILFRRHHTQLYSTHLLVWTEWIAMTICTVMIFLNKKRKFFLWIASLVFGFSVLEYFTNHKLLIWLNLFYLTLFYSLKQNEQMKKNDFLRIIQIQTLVVYWFAAINKLNHGFYSGETLSNTLSLIVGSPYEIILSKGIVQSLADNMMLMKISSILTIIFQFAFPVFLFLKFWLGFSLVLLFHLTLCLFFPGLYPFTLIMVTMSLCFK